jgi:hypothetical protein
VLTESGRFASFFDQVFEQDEKWKKNPPSRGLEIRPWFRGEPSVDQPLLPKLYRRLSPYPENELLQHFRRMAALRHSGVGVDRSSTDQWLYLARHAGLPTRLLDWTESALTALFFAVQHRVPALVWMLQPCALNFASGIEGFELPWHPPTVTAAAIRAAWQCDQDTNQPQLPVAIYPTHIHPRLQVQQSCFTVHGRKKRSLRDLMREEGWGHFIRPIQIDPNYHRTIAQQLRILGVSQSSLFPDLDGLAADLATQFWEEP